MKVRLSIGIAAALISLLAVGLTGSQAASSTQGNDPNTPWYIDYISDTTDTGSHVSIAIDEDHNNTPWIAYYSSYWESLMVAHYVGAGEGNCNANDAWYCEMVDREVGVVRGLYTSIAIHPDTNTSPFLSTWKVGVSYYDSTHHTLKYARYACALGGDCEWTAQTVDSSADGADTVGKFTSIKYTSDGTAQISYHVNDRQGDFNYQQVVYAYYVGGGSGNCGDDSNWQCQSIDGAYAGTTGYFGAYTSLDLDYEDRVFISYYDGINGSVKYAYYIGFGGSCGNSGDWDCRVIDDRDSGVVGLYTFLHAADSSSDYLRVAYYDQTGGELMYAYDIAGTGNCGEMGNWRCDAIDDIGADLSIGSISMVMDTQGKPMIAYSDGSPALGPLGLKVASPASGETYANCGGEIIYDWYCRELDNGDAYLDVAQYVGLAVKPDGQAIIAYSEIDSYEYPAEARLKIAYQVLTSQLPLVVK